MDLSTPARALSKVACNVYPFTCNAPLEVAGSFGLQVNCLSTGASNGR